MNSLFLVKKMLSALVLPPNGPFILTILGFVSLRARPRLGRGLVTVGFLALLGFSSPVVAWTLLHLLDDSPPLDQTRTTAARAIVILGGGVRPNAQEYDGDTLGRLTLERVRYGALVARMTRLPVLVTGGAVFTGRSEADLMKHALEQEFGIPVKWSEPKSRNTRENARMSAEILSRSGIQQVILVAHAFDMRRAKAEFAAAGIAVIPAPTMIPGPWSFESPFDLLPNPSALQSSYWALYELLANAVRVLGL